MWRDRAQVQFVSQLCDAVTDRSEEFKEHIDSLDQEAIVCRCPRHRDHSSAPQKPFEFGKEANGSVFLAIGSASGPPHARGLTRGTDHRLYRSRAAASDSAAGRNIAQSYAASQGAALSKSTPPREDEEPRGRPMRAAKMA